MWRKTKKKHWLDTSGMTFPLPRDIESDPETVHVDRDGREQCNCMTRAGKMEYRHRVEQMWTRQKGRCCLCGQLIRFEDAEFEHQDGRGMGGGHRDDRIILPDGTWTNGAACHFCNSEKGSKRIDYNKNLQVTLTKKEV